MALRHLWALTIVSALSTACGGVGADEAIDVEGPERMSVWSLGDVDDRILLTTTPAVGARWQGTVVDDSQMRVVAEGRPLAPRAPVAAVDVTTDITYTDDSGRVSVATEATGILVVDPGEFESADLAGRERSLDEFVGTIAYVTTDEFGVITDVQTALPYAIDPVLARGLVDDTDLLTAYEWVRPNVPVGVGASWTDSVDIMTNGVDFVVESTYTITDIDSNVVTIAIEYSQTTDSVANVNGAEVAVNGQVAGEGQIVLRVGDPGPRTMTLDVHGGFSMRSDEAPDEQPATLTLDKVLSMTER